MKKILLINTSYKDLHTEEKGTCTCPPLGILYLGAVLEKEGHNVSVIDCMVEIDVSAKIVAFKPDIIGISATTFSFRNALEIASFARKNFPETLIIFGGCHASYFDKTILEKCRFIDAVVRFEGEYTMKEIAAGNVFKSIKGLTYRDNGQIVRSQDRIPIANLDELPFMARHLVEHNEYGHIHKKIIMAKLNEYAVMLTTRGCPRNCNFCASEFLSRRRVRFVSAKKVCEEIRMLSQKGIRFITFYDEDFLVNKERVKIICSMLKKEGISFSCMTRVDMVSDDIIRLIADSGCKYIFYGIENYSEKVLKYFNKRITVNQVKNAIAIALKYRLCILSGFMVGTPIENEEDFEINLKELLASGIDWPDFARLSFLPGTALWNSELASGRLNEKLYWDRPVFTEDLYPGQSKDAIILSIKRLRKAFFFNPKYLLRQIWRGIFWRFDFIVLNKLNIFYAFTSGINKSKKDSGFN